MYKKPYAIVSLKMHTDPRGSLFEILRFKDEKIPGKGYVYCFTINPGQERGGHYHTKKHEWFSCVSGKATVIIQAKKGKKKEILLNAAKPTVVYCSPYTLHALYNKTNKTAVIISYGSRQHDPNDPDKDMFLDGSLNEEKWYSNNHEKR